MIGIVLFIAGMVLIAHGHWILGIILILIAVG